MTTSKKPAAPKKPEPKKPASRPDPPARSLQESMAKWEIEINEARRAFDQAARHLEDVQRGRNQAANEYREARLEAAKRLEAENSRANA